MWHRKDKVWMHYLNDTIAADVASAVFLTGFMKRLRYSRQHFHFIEVLDLQKYKVISKAAKVKTALNTRIQLPFVFAVGKN